jgi:hypothetical protein
LLHWWITVFIDEAGSDRTGINPVRVIEAFIDELQGHGGR